MKKVTSGSQGGNEKTYAVGEEFCLENECFYVIKDNGTTVDAAKQNVNTETNRQDVNANLLSFSPVDESKKMDSCTFLFLVSVTMDTGQIILLIITY